MTAGRPDPYGTLGVARTASEVELRAAYRRLVQLHHPDHNGGSAEAARRFEEVQDAYAQVRRMRGFAAPGRPQDGQPASGRPRDASPTGERPGEAPPTADPGADARLAELERELEQARRAREKAIREAQRVARQQAHERATDEELGYVTTDDSFTKILDDVAAKLAARFSEREK